MISTETVNLSKLPNGLKELISRARKLGLEEGEPEELGILAFLEDLADLSLQIGVNDIFHINLIKIVGPWMQNLEALIFDLLFAVPLNVGSEEIEGGLISLDWVLQVVFDNILLLSQEGSDGFDARSRLQVLAIDELLDVLVEVLNLWIVLLNPHLLKDSNEDCSVSLKVPVLVDDLMDNTSLEHLVCLVYEQIHEIVHIIDLLSILHVFSAVLRQKLLSQKSDEVSHIVVLSKFDVLLREF